MKQYILLHDAVINAKRDAEIEGYDMAVTVNDRGLFEVHAVDDPDIDLDSVVTVIFAESAG